MLLRSSPGTWEHEDRNPEGNSAGKGACRHRAFRWLGRLTVARPAHRAVAGALIHERGGDESAAARRHQQERRIRWEPRAATLGKGASWIDAEGKEQPVTLDDIVIIAPYNAQVFEIQQHLQVPVSAP